MKNTWTKGTEGKRLALNEDKPLFMVITAYDATTNIVTARKVWDQSANPTLLYALNTYKGLMFVGQHVIFYRVGDKNETSGVSWLCISTSPIVTVQSDSLGSGTEVRHDTGNWVTSGGTLTLVSSTSSSLFYGSPPFEEGRVYFGQKVGNAYVVFLEGVAIGNVGTTQEIEVSNDDYDYTLELDLTSDGRILDFRANAEEKIIYTELIAYPKFWDGADSFINTSLNTSFCSTHPYLAFCALTKASGFRPGSKTMGSWYKENDTDGLPLPGNFYKAGDSAFAYQYAVYGGTTDTWKGGFIYVNRLKEDWWWIKIISFFPRVQEWHLGLLGQSNLVAKALEYKADEYGLRLSPGRGASFNVCNW